MSRAWISAALRQLVRERASRLCEYCLLHEDDSLHGFQVDHVISEKHQGPTEDHNLCLCCAACNLAKGSDIASLVSSRIVRLFNPRIDVWSEHFSLDGPLIRAHTRIGIATLRLLGINSKERVELRSILVQHGSYPSTAARRFLGIATS
jgi:hypothetical protein